MRASSTAINRARGLRAAMTGPERRLWSKLRAHRMVAAHFRRQAPLGPYVLDFFCHAAHLVIELDGDQHDRPDIQARDQKRDDWLRQHGMTILRFSNWQVMNEFDSVLLTIEAALVECAPPSRAPSPPSPGGGGSRQS